MLKICCRSDYNEVHIIVSVSKNKGNHRLANTGRSLNESDTGGTGTEGVVNYVKEFFLGRA